LANLEKATLLDVQVYNLMGQRVQAVPLATYPIGKQEVVMNTAILPNGMYWLSMRDAAGGVQSVRFVVAR
jgi:hypothetical protein